MTVFITETELRAQFSLSAGSEIHLPADARLTPAAKGLLSDRQIHVKYHDEDGRSFVDVGTPTEQAELKQVAVLTGKNDHGSAHCLLCAQTVRTKPDTLTSLDGHTLVAKNDARLKLRGKLDTAIGYCVWIQTEQTPAQLLVHWLADIRSALGNVLKSEVTGDTMLPVVMGGLSEKIIHAASHNPLKYLGHDHLVPEVGQGAQVARLNLLRAHVREAELIAADVFITHDFKVTRPDIMQALNRISSEVYVLMLATLMAEQGRAITPEKTATWI